MSLESATMNTADDVPAIPVLGRWWTIGAALLTLAVLLLWIAGYGPGASSCRMPLLGSAAAPVAPAAPSAAVIPSAEAATVAAAPAPAPPEVLEPAPASEPAAEAPPAPAPLPAPLTIYFALGRPASRPGPTNSWRPSSRS